MASNDDGYCTVLPQEIIDEIIDQLQHCTSSLKACTWVCHSWLARARKHLFHNFTFPPERAARQWAFQLDPDAFRERIRTLLMELSDCTLQPSFASVVSNLTINCQYTQMIPLMSSDLFFSQFPFQNLRKVSLERFPPFHRNKVLHVDSFGGFIQRNPFLQSFAFVRTPFVSAEEFISTMQTIGMHSRNLRSLVLYGVQVPRSKQGCSDLPYSQTQVDGKCFPYLESLDVRSVFDDAWVASLLEKLFHTSSHVKRSGYVDANSIHTVVLGARWYLYDKVLMGCGLVTQLKLDMFSAGESRTFVFHIIFHQLFE